VQALVEEFVKNQLLLWAMGVAVAFCPNRLLIPAKHEGLLFFREDLGLQSVVLLRPRLLRTLPVLCKDGVVGLGRLVFGNFAKDGRADTAYVEMVLNEVLTGPC
jgi:hypothetical protein